MVYVKVMNAAMNLCITKAEEGLATSDFRLQTSDCRLDKVRTPNF